MRKPNEETMEKIIEGQKEYLRNQNKNAGPFGLISYQNLDDAKGGMVDLYKLFYEGETSDEIIQQSRDVDMPSSSIIHDNGENSPFFLSILSM